MDSQLKVTDQPQEASFEDVVAGDNVINIPLFQRAYRWTERNLNEFWDDIQEISEEKTKSQFLGVLVTVSQSRQIGRPVVYDVVDGQQRLTTCYLAILAIASVAAMNDEADWSKEVCNTYLLLRPFSGNPYNTKLVPAFNDRLQFKVIWDEYCSQKCFQGVHTWQPDRKPSPPAPAGIEKGAMSAQFGRLVKKFRRVWDEHGKVGTSKLLTTLVSNLSFVQISLRDPTAAPKIFERLNARGERITTGDLVRNEVFARVADDPNAAYSVFSNHWEPFVAKFNSNKVDLESLLFPYGLMHNPSTTKADLFSVLQSKWTSLGSPESIINDMSVYVPTLMLLERGLLDQKIPRGLQEQLSRLHKMGAPSSIYAFVLRLIKEVGTESIKEDEASKILLLIESFLFRRAICGYEPTGLHAVFKGIWQEVLKNGDKINAKNIANAIAGRTTVPWPKDDEVISSIVDGNLYHRKICRFAVHQHEISIEGETPSDGFQIEHIAPQKPTDEWLKAVGNEYETLKNTWGNLIPVTAAMNPSIGQSAFEIKRSEFSESIFATARSISKKRGKWDAVAIRERSKSIAQWAIKRWPDPR